MVKSWHWRIFLVLGLPTVFWVSKAGWDCLTIIPAGWKSDKPEEEDLPTKLITLRITEVGPRPGSAFGGIQRIKIWGCFGGQKKANYNYPIIIKLK